MINENKIRKAIRKHLFECMDEISECGAGMMDEERIPNDEAKEFVRNKENFIGSHIWGEKIGEDYYLVASYGEQFPLFIYDGKQGDWFENGDEYTFDGEPTEQTEEHRAMLKPGVDMHTKSLEWMLNKLQSIKAETGISELKHTSVEPGEKN
jgi:hypothetical protein